MEERFKPYAAVLMMLIKDDSILLLRRANTDWANGMYTLPSGHVDEGERVTQAAIRETKEEVGVDIDENCVDFAHVLHRKNNENGRVYVDFFMRANSWTGQPTIMETDKCDDVRWFKLSDLPENIVPFVRDVLQACNSGIHFSESGWSN